MQKSKTSVFALLALVIAVLACNPSTTATIPPPPPTVPPATAAPPTTVPPTPPSDARGPGFAAYPEIPVTLPAAYEGYTLPPR